MKLFSKKNPTLTESDNELVEISHQCEESRKEVKALQTNIELQTNKQKQKEFILQKKVQQTQKVKEQLNGLKTLLERKEDEIKGLNSQLYNLESQRNDLEKEVRFQESHLREVNQLLIDKKGALSNEAQSIARSKSTIEDLKNKQILHDNELKDMERRQSQLAQESSLVKKQIQKVQEQIQAQRDINLSSELELKKLSIEKDDLATRLSHDSQTLDRMKEKKALIDEEIQHAKKEIKTSLQKKEDLIATQAEILQENQDKKEELIRLEKDLMTLEQDTVLLKETIETNVQRLCDTNKELADKLSKRVEIEERAHSYHCEIEKQKNSLIELENEKKTAISRTQHLEEVIKTKEDEYKDNSHKVLETRKALQVEYFAIEKLSLIESEQISKNKNLQQEIEFEELKLKEAIDLKNCNTKKIESLDHEEQKLKEQTQILNHRALEIDRDLKHTMDALAKKQNRVKNQNIILRNKETIILNKEKELEEKKRALTSKASGLLLDQQRLKNIEAFEGNLRAENLRLENHLSDLSNEILKVEKFYSQRKLTVEKLEIKLSELEKKELQINSELKQRNDDCLNKENELNERVEMMQIKQRRINELNLTYIDRLARHKILISNLKGLKDSILHDSIKVLAETKQTKKSLEDARNEQTRLEAELEQARTILEINQVALDSKVKQIHKSNELIQSRKDELAFVSQKITQLESNITEQNQMRLSLESDLELISASIQQSHETCQGLEVRSEGHDEAIERYNNSIAESLIILKAKEEQLQNAQQVTLSKETELRIKEGEKRLLDGNLEMLIQGLDESFRLQSEVKTKMNQEEDKIAQLKTRISQTREIINKNQDKPSNTSIHTVCEQYFCEPEVRAILQVSPKIRYIIDKVEQSLVDHHIFVSKITLSAHEGSVRIKLIDVFESANEFLNTLNLIFKTEMTQKNVSLHSDRIGDQELIRIDVLNNKAEIISISNDRSLENL